jgi:hypothetical protein
LSELAIESFFPADAATAETLRHLAGDVARLSPICCIFRQLRAVTHATK